MMQSQPDKKKERNWKNMNPKAQHLITGISRLEIQGASQVRSAAVKALEMTSAQSKAATMAGFRSEVLGIARGLVHARPTEPGLRTAVRIILADALESSSVADAKKAIQQRIRSYEKDRVQSMQKTAKHFQSLLGKKSTILTHCHSHTVEAAIIASRKKIDTVYCTETRPLFQGRITATNLAKARLRVIHLVDSAVLEGLKDSDLFVTGADAILSNGNVVNKIGTRLISLAAKAHGVPHIVCTSTHTFDPLTFFGWPEPIEERSADEVWKGAPHGVHIRNPAFDETPAEHVSKIVCEDGIFSPKAFARHMKTKLKLKQSRKQFVHWMKEMKLR